MDYKHLGVLVVISMVAIVSGCTSQPAASGITRTITPTTVSPDGTVTVTLDVTVNEERFYIIEEIPPSNWTVVDVGELIRDNKGHLKYVQLQNAADKTFTFTMKAPSSPGSYTFSGIYQMDGMEDPADISGPSSVTVS
jgi:hypothetical protein